MPDTAIPAADLSSMDATIAALDAALASGESVPGAGSLADDSNLNDFNAAPALPAVPAAPAAAEPIPATAPVPPVNEGTPAPFDPTKELDPTLSKNWRLGDDLRVTAQNAVEQTAFKLRKQANAEGRNLSLGEAEQEAYKVLGLTLPAAPAATPPASSVVDEPPVLTVAETLAAQIQELRAERKALNAALDSELYTHLTEQIEDLTGQVSVVRAQAEFESAQRHQQDIAAEMQSAEAQFNRVASVFTDLQDDNSEFAQRFAALHNANVSSNSPMLEGSDYEIVLARMVAGEFMEIGKPFKVNSAATTPAASPVNTPPGTPPAAPAPATARTAPAPAAMAPLPGNPAPTSEHRVIVQSTDPLVAAQQQIASAAAAGDTASVLEALNLSLGGQAPRTGLAFHSID